MATALTIGVEVVGEGTPRFIVCNMVRRAVCVYPAIRRERENTLEPQACVCTQLKKNKITRLVHGIT